MKAPKSLRRPINWQDFETLCKKLWGEIWNCPEIKKNGRAGQNQNGVDIYGIPEGEINYYGIQCKGKDEYTDKQFSEEEIKLEIEKAKLFEPKLKKLFLTTTAVKDARIEAFVRKKNIDHLQNGLFEVHLFCWEDIVDLIDENRQTYDWYVNSQNYKASKKAILTFQDGSLELNPKITFIQNVTEYKQKELTKKTLFDNSIFERFSSYEARITPLSPYDDSINNSFCEFFFKLHNLGNDPIEDFKVLFNLEGEYQELVRLRNWFGMIPPKQPIKYNLYLNEDGGSGKIVPERNILVSEDILSSDSLSIKPIPSKSTVNIQWRLISKDFKTEGALKLNFDPELIRKSKTIWVESASEVRIEEGEFKDYITIPQ